MPSYYIAAFIPPFIFNGDHSGHATIAYDKQDIYKYNPYIGNIVRIAVSDYITKHVVNDLKYAYRDVRIEFTENNKLIKINTHTSLKYGGTQYKQNKIHQENNPKEFKITDKWVIFTTLITPYSHTTQAPNITFDLDNTLIDLQINQQNAINQNFQFLRNDTLITEDVLTYLGKLVIALQIPFIIVTSRRYAGEKLNSKILKLFPNCNYISYGKKITSEDRSTEKALDKLKRIPPDAIHFDDEEIVAKTVSGRKVWFDKKNIYTKLFMNYPQYIHV